MKKSIAEIVRAAMAPVTEANWPSSRSPNEQLAAKDLERSPRRRRSSAAPPPEFVGYPGGAVAAVKMLKSIAGLADDERGRHREDDDGPPSRLARRGGMTVAPHRGRTVPAPAPGHHRASPARRRNSPSPRNIPEAEALGPDRPGPECFGDLVLQAEAEAMASN